MGDSSYEMRLIGEVYVARSAVVVGDVTIGAQSNIWPHCAIRGDVAPITIGQRVNVQDGTILHCNKGVPLDIADDVAIGHQATVHCRSVGPFTLVGMRATILDDCEIGTDCLIAAGAVVPPGTIVPDGKVVMGLPGKVVRDIRPKEREYIRLVSKTYLDLARQHADGVYPPFGQTQP